MTIVLTDDLIDAAQELQSLRNEMGKLKKSETQLRERILDALGESERGLTAAGMPAVHIETQHRRGVNRDKLEAMFPEVFETVMEETEVRVLKVDLQTAVTL